MILFVTILVRVIWSRRGLVPLPGVDFPNDHKDHKFQRCPVALKIPGE